MFSFQQLPKGARVALITNAGGPGIIATDAIERSALKMAEFSKDTIEYCAISCRQWQMYIIP
ncbi:hypothetical protein [Candidatus Kuenenia stuttgartiensis]|uniref:hypothetical protein n=1 Tax=Kuenenia stuttgartiensis TaxID=174633 RepID=UPI001B8D1F75|nr:hypothetical protein [Candidatus Kuenenia stuttgartiensis]